MRMAAAPTKRLMGSSLCKMMVEERMLDVELSSVKNFSTFPRIQIE